MRRWNYLGFSLLVFATQAGQLPLTVNQIGLMLRAGYSSNSLTHELSTRHFADTVDETNEKALVKAGASAELIAALKSGIYSLSPEKTAAVQQQIAAEEQRRAEQSEASRKSEAAYQARVVRERSAKPAPIGPDVNFGTISEFLKGDLVQMHNGAPSHVDDGALANKNAASGIPSLVLVNSIGKVISSSYDGSQYVGPEKVLADLDAIFAGKASARLAAK